MTYLICDDNDEPVDFAMNDSKNAVKKAFEHRPSARVPRGEVWVGTTVLRQAELEDNVAGHAAFCRQMGMDLVVLPLAEEARRDEIQGYRYFTLEEIRTLSEIKDLFTAVIVDGPFQRLTQDKGLMEIFTLWARDRAQFLSGYTRETIGVENLIRNACEFGLDAVIIADDIASEKNTYFSPKEIRKTFIPFYLKISTLVHHQGKARALFHSCGNFGALIPDLLDCGFDGLAACQDSALDLASLKQREGPRLTLIAGIDAELLQAPLLDASRKDAFSKLVGTISRKGGFILSSSCGLYSPDFLERLRELYILADAQLSESNRPTPA